MTARAYDMSQHWRLVNVEGKPISGTFWVDVEPGKDGRRIVRAVDVVVWHEEAAFGRVLSSKDLTAWVKGDEVDLSKHMIRSDVLADVEAHWDAMLDALRQVAATMDGGDPA